MFQLCDPEFFFLEEAKATLKSNRVTRTQTRRTRNSLGTLVLLALLLLVHGALRLLAIDGDLLHNAALFALVLPALLALVLGALCDVLLVLFVLGLHVLLLVLLVHGRRVLPLVLLAQVLVAGNDVALTDAAVAAVIVVAAPVGGAALAQKRHRRRIEHVATRGAMMAVFQQQHG